MLSSHMLGFDPHIFCIFTGHIKIFTRGIKIFSGHIKISSHLDLTFCAVVQFKAFKASGLEVEKKIPKLFTVGNFITSSLQKSK